MRKAASWLGLDEGALVRQWLISPAAWLHADEGDSDLRSAVEEMAGHVTAARTAAGSAPDPSLTSFVGIVQRMDESVAELQASSGERLLVPRRDLEREGLATPGEAVSILREELPGGRVLNFASAAAALDIPRRIRGFEPFGGPTTFVLGSADSGWVQRVLTSEPKVLSTGVLPLVADAHF